jgi:anti-sigma factor RsiW
MNNIEETLWNYIDGNCTADEQQATSVLIAADEAVRLKYQELLKLNSEFAAMELDEPSMAFTYNVIEAIRAGHAQQPLKATINKRIIKGIGLFFVVTILALLVFALSNMNFAGGGTAVAVSTGIKLPNLSAYLSKPVLEGFLFFDTVLGLFLFDKYLRKKHIAA